MKRKILSSALALLLLAALPLRVYAADLLIPGGQIIGLELQNDTVTVAAFDDGYGAAAREAGLRVGDTIIKMDATPVHSAADVKMALRRCDGDVEITVLRGSKEESITLSPCQTKEGPKLGVYLRQGIAGIGTVTFYDPDTHRFGTLGHGVNDSGGSLLHMTGGSAYGANIIAVKKGKSGTPGQLQGSAATPESLGNLSKNTPQGVFGKLDQPLRGEPLPVADFDEIHPGPATIRSTVDSSGPREYSVEILKIYPDDRTDGRNFLLHITDSELLTKTGGIVQGMGVIDNMDNTKKPVKTGFSVVTLNNEPNIGV